MFFCIKLSKLEFATVFVSASTDHVDCWCQYYIKIAKKHRSNYMMTRQVNLVTHVLAGYASSQVFDCIQTCIQDTIFTEMQ
ncbi:hypothetical protein GLYMA_12G220850v4 [Glycine max]|nr:hypothetical protein GLYMA_12G220850v4 [Glycine max]KAH1144379.1 hypothetical protein GYH30_034556 [Glycine max]